MRVVLSAAAAAWVLGAATFTVNSTADAPDLVAGDGICSTSAASQVCTLRGAVQEANALAGADTIVLPGAAIALNLAGGGEDRGATGDLDVSSPITIRGAGAQRSIIDAARLDRGFHVLSGGSLTLQRLTIRSGASPEDGGGIRVEARASVNLSEVSLLDCTTSASGGGLWAAAGAQAVIQQSIIAFDRAARQGGGLSVGGSARISNTTVSSNKAGGAGGGLHVPSGGSVQLTHVTVHNNAAPAGSAFAGPGAASAVNSILSAMLPGIGPACSTPVRSSGHNLSSDATCGLTAPGDLESRDPMLSPLYRPSRSPTLTHDLLPASPAIDAGDNGASLPNDQHNHPRPGDGNGDGIRIADIGALEHVLDLPYGSAYVTNPSPLQPISRIDTLLNTAAGTILVTRTEHIAAHPTQDQIWVSSPSFNKVYVIDTNTNAVITSFNPGFTPHEVFLNPSGTLCFVPFGNTATYVFSTATFQLAGGTLPARYMTFSPSGDAAYLKYSFGLPGGGTASVIAMVSLPDLVVGPTAVSGSGPIFTDGFRLYNGSGPWLEFRSAVDLQTFFSIPIPNGQPMVEFTGGQAPPRLYAATDGAVYSVDLTSDQIIGNISVNGTSGLALHPNNRYLALVRRSLGLYSAADAQNLSVTADIPISGTPFKVALKP